MAEGILQIGQQQGDAAQTLVDDAAEAEARRNLYNAKIKQQNKAEIAQAAGAALGYAGVKHQQKKYLDELHKMFPEVQAMPESSMSSPLTAGIKHGFSAFGSMMKHLFKPSEDSVDGVVPENEVEGDEVN